MRYDAHKCPSCYSRPVFAVSLARRTRGKSRNKFSDGCCLEGFEPEDHFNDVGFSQTGTGHSEALFLPVGNLNREEDKHQSPL